MDIIFKCQEWAAQQVENKDGIKGLCFKYADNGRHLLQMRQHPRDNISWWEAALKDAPDRRGEGIAHGNLGIAHKNIGDFKMAIVHHEQQLSIAREIRNRRSEGRAHGGLGLAYYWLEEYDKALSHQIRYLEIAREDKEPRDEGVSLGGLVNTYYKMKKFG